MSQLFEDYRPRAWCDVVGQDKAVAKLTALKTRSGFTGRAYWITGASGTGKTTIAKLIAAEVADDFGVEEMDAGSCTVDALQDAERSWRCRTIGSKGGHALIVNEAHGIRKSAIRQLLVMLERIPRHAVVIFTTTTEGQDALFEDCDDASPLLSRCLRVDLARRDLCEPFAARVVSVCRANGLLNGMPDAHYVKRAERFLKQSKNNCRALFQAAEAGYLTEADEHGGAA